MEQQFESDRDEYEKIIAAMEETVQQREQKYSVNICEFNGQNVEEITIRAISLFLRRRLVTLRNREQASERSSTTRNGIHASNGRSR